MIIGGGMAYTFLKIKAVLDQPFVRSRNRNRSSSSLKPETRTTFFVRFREDSFGCFLSKNNQPIQVV